MKHLIFAIALMAVLASCSESKKEILPAPHEKGEYRVLVGGKGDTSISSTMFAKMETVGLVIVEDSKLKAVLVSYHKDVNGNGVYGIEVTNKTNCQGIIRWHWEGLTIDNITPGSDVVPANHSVTFTLTGDSKIGKIKLKADFVGSCGNSSELIINITMDVLPIRLVGNVAHYDETTDKVTVSFTIEDPMEADWIIIQKLINKEWKQAMVIGSDHVTKSYNIKL